VLRLGLPWGDHGRQEFAECCEPTCPPTGYSRVDMAGWCPGTFVCVTPPRVTYFRDLGLRDLPLPFGEHGSCVRPSRAAGIVGLAARLVCANEVCSAVLIFAAAPPPGRQTGPRCCPPRSVSVTARPKDPIRRHIAESARAIGRVTASSRPPRLPVMAPALTFARVVIRECMPGLCCADEGTQRGGMLASIFRDLGWVASGTEVFSVTFGEHPVLE
jgi:hypothetical protein